MKKLIFKFFLFIIFFFSDLHANDIFFHYEKIKNQIKTNHLVESGDYFFSGSFSKYSSIESIDIENSDGTLYAKVIDIVGPAHMRPVVSNGVWKGTEQISEMNDEQAKEDPAIKAKQKRADQIKKQVLLKKIQAVRQGGGENIMASYEPSNWRADKNMRINKLMDR